MGRWVRRGAKGLVFGLAVALFVHVLRGADLATLSAQISALGPRVLLVALPYLIVLGWETLGFSGLLAQLGHRLSFARIMGVRLASEAVLLSMPAGAVVAETVKIWLLSRGDPAVPTAEVVATLSVKKLLTMGAQALYLVLALSTGAVLLAWPIVLAAAVLALVASIALASLRAPAARLHALLRRVPLRRVRGWLEERRAGFHASDRALGILLGSRSRLAGNGLAFLAGWVCEAFESFVILRLLGVSMGFGQALAVEATMSVLRAVVFFVPAGLGVQDLAWVGALGALGAPDATATGAAFAALKRAKELFWIAVGLLLFGAMRSRVTAQASEPRAP